MIMHLVNIKIVSFEIQALQRIASISDHLLCSCANHVETDVLEEDDTILLDKSLGDLGYNISTRRFISGTKKKNWYIIFNLLILSMANLWASMSAWFDTALVVVSVVGTGAAVAPRVRAASILPVTSIREIKSWLVMRL